MIDLDKAEFFLLPLGNHHGEKSLGHIATEIYGRKYNALQALERASNDTYERYDMSTKGGCEEFVWDHYKPLDRWLNMKIGDDISHPWQDREEIATHDFEIEREAPDPAYVIADLILKGHLPYGKYLCEVMW